MPSFDRSLPPSLQKSMLARPTQSSAFPMVPFNTRPAASLPVRPLQEPFEADPYSYSTSSTPSPSWASTSPPMAPLSPTSFCDSPIYPSPYACYPYELPASSQYPVHDVRAEKPKRKQAKKACIPCRISNKKCSETGARPCDRCMRVDASACRDAPPSEKQRKMQHELYGWAQRREVPETKTHYF